VRRKSRFCLLAEPRVAGAGDRPLGLPRLLKIVIALAVCALTTWLLLAVAQWSLTAHLRDEAAHLLALAATGESPYHWRFRNVEDIVAGRAFGAVKTVFRDDTLIVEAGHDAFDVGLPLRRAVDLQRFPHVRIVVDRPEHTELRVVARERLDGAERSSAPLALVPGSAVTTLDLRRLDWFEQDQRVDAPRTAAMLRLRFALEAGQRVRIEGVTLTRLDDAQRIDLSAAPAAIVLPEDARARDTALQRVAQETDPRTTPLVRLPQRGSVETQILLRNTILDAMPAAIVVPDNAYAESFVQARAQQHDEVERAPDTPRWFFVALYAVAAVLVRLRPPRHARLRALAEILVAVAAPCWLILGGNYRGNADPWQVVAIICAIIFVLSLRTRAWQWSGSARAWLLALAVPVCALAIGLLGHHDGIPTREFGPWLFERYLVWALLQQYVLCVVCTERWLIVTGNSMQAVYIGALSFGFLHWPNAHLMLATFAGGLCWCSLYLRERALLPLAVSHTLSALVLLALLPPELLLNADVGVRFFQ
jgi:hypothetical protein